MDLRVELPKIRVLPTPDERLRTLAQGADHAEAWAEKARARAEPVVEKVYLFRTRLATGAVAVLAAWLFVHVMFGANGMVVYRSKRTEYQDLQKEIGQLQKENDAYTSQISQLKTDPKANRKGSSRAIPLRASGRGGLRLSGADAPAARPRLTRQ